MCNIGAHVFANIHLNIQSIEQTSRPMRLCCCFAFAPHSYTLTQCYMLPLSRHTCISRLHSFPKIKTAPIILYNNDVDYGDGDDDGNKDEEEKQPRRTCMHSSFIFFFLWSVLSAHRQFFFLLLCFPIHRFEPSNNHPYSYCIETASRCDSFFLVFFLVI